MEARIVCKQNKYNVQGYDFWGFGFHYQCPKCKAMCSTKFCGECGTKIEYPKKPENFELYEVGGEWLYSNKE